MAQTAILQRISRSCLADSGLWRRRTGSLTVDSITWHFGNFGEPGLVAETEAGLIELGLHDLASCFREAKELMMPLISERTESETSYDVLERKGLQELADELNRKAWAHDKTPSGKSAIYEAWVRYTRQHPERVFDGG